MLGHATDILKRAELRAGEILALMKEGGQRQKAGDNQHRGSSDVQLPPKLADLGISKTQSSRWQALAAKPRPIAAAFLAVEPAYRKPLCGRRSKTQQIQGLIFLVCLILKIDDNRMVMWYAAPLAISGRGRLCHPSARRFT
jgi:hypothetical protein